MWVISWKFITVGRTEEEAYGPAVFFGPIAGLFSVFAMFALGDGIAALSDPLGFAILKLLGK